MIRSHLTWVALSAALILPASVARAQLVNPSFEDGLNGWSVLGGTVGVDVDAYTEGVSGPLGTTPNAPDGTKYAGIIKGSGTTTDEVSIWQEYIVQNHTPGQIVNFQLEFDAACWANDESGDPNSQVEMTIGWANDGIWDPDDPVDPDDPADPRRVCDVSRLSHKYTGNDNGDDPFRHVRITGTLPDDPQEIILRIKFVHNGDSSQSNQTLVDNIVFSAESGAAPAPPAVNLLVNGDFETEPYNVTYDPYTASQPYPTPAGWVHGGDGSQDDGPGEGFTNAGTEPPPLPHDTDPLGVVTTDGTHFYGVAKPNQDDADPLTDVGTQPKMTIYQIVPVSGYTPCATGLRFKLHYRSNNSVDPEPSWWDHSGTEVHIRWMTDGSEPPPPTVDEHGHVVGPSAAAGRWFAPLWSHVRYTNNEQTTMVTVDASGELDTLDSALKPVGVEYVILEVRVNTWRPPSEEYIYRALVDDVQFEVEAIVPPDVRILDESPLPDADCEAAYAYQLTGCYEEPLTFSVVDGILPPGLELSSDGLISGLATSGATYSFTVQLEDGLAATTTREFEITAVGNCCGVISADFDEDGDVDQDDFALLQMCVADQILLPPDHPDCTCADLDHDQLDVDQADFAEFEICASGPDVPADPNCDNEACCFSDGTCEDLHYAVCSDRGGAAQGAGTECATAACPQPEACCFANGSCQEIPADECLALDGAPRGPGSECATHCTSAPEACCFASGSCVNTSPFVCLQAHATPMGLGTTCGTVTCP